MTAFFKNKEKRTLVFLFISAAALLMSFFEIDSLPFDPAFAAVVLCGIPILKDAVVGLFTRFDIKADVLVAIALISALIIGEIFAAGEVAFIMAIGAYLEERTVSKARAGIERLVALTPVSARVLRGGAEQVIPASQVKVGDTLRVLAGESIPVDGFIIRGQTSIDQSVMTGESLPVDKSEGDEVKAGTVNQFGSFDMKAEKVGQDSSIQRMIKLVESADAGKAKIVGTADRWATWIVAAALLSALITWLITREPIRAVTILVVFCPCALVLATPTAIMAGIGNAAKLGILVREGDALERLSQVGRVAFDKTGTLTYGSPSVSLVCSLDPELSDEDLFSLAASAEMRSEHPLGRALVSSFRERYSRQPEEPSDFLLIPGRGVSALVSGQRVLAGNAAFLSEMGAALTDSALSLSEDARAEGRTVIYIARDSRIAGIIALSDSLRPDAGKTVSDIHATGFRTLLLTGDSKPSAEYISSAVGISDVRSDCLPEEKLNEIEGYQKKGELICMVGDGINDAPALKTAHVGIAMGGIGSDIAIDAADIVLVGDDIRHIPHLLGLSKKTMQTIRINLAASMALNFAAIALAISGVLNPVMGALVHNAGSVAVIINSALLLKWRKNI